MRKLTKILTGAAIVATGLALAMPAAKADPAKGTTPAYFDIVGVGSNTTEYVLDQVSYNYDAISDKKYGNVATHPLFYSWDATNPYTPTSTAKIVTKAGCAAIERPNGSGAGVTALEENARTTDDHGGYYCIDYARSSSGRSSSAPAKGAGGVLYVPFAEDAVTWATDATTDAPKSLTLTQLAEIYDSKVTNWDQVGGKNAAIKAYIPDTSSGTRTFFLKEIGVTTLGSKVEAYNPEENEGTDPVFKNDPNAIFIYSIGDWVSQKYHSGKGQNTFGTNVSGYLQNLGEVNGKPPVVNSGTTKKPDYIINVKFSAETVKGVTSYPLVRKLYNVVRYDATAKADMQPRELPFFGPKADGGYLCSATGTTIIEDYGFLPYAGCGFGV
jgi:ABC-type phosphate transport system substrate-binding protein